MIIIEKVLNRFVLAILAALVFCSAKCQAFSAVAGGNHHHWLPSWVRGSSSRRRSLLATSLSSSSSSSSSSLLLPSSSSVSSSQVLEFKEPTTGVTVKLVGCMHYNPASIQLASKVIHELARDNRLGSVVIESCDIRWEQTKQLPLFLQNSILLQSEMKAAYELSTREYQRPVVLGDQRINITVASMKRGFQETLVDLVTPWKGGWKNLVGNVTTARQEALPFGDGDDDYLNAFSFLDPKLLLAAPVSLIKYPLSYFFKAPLKTSAFFTLLFFIEQPADAATIVTMDQMTVNDWLGTLSVTAVEIALLARVFLKELLAERNKLLALNILEQCKLYQTTTTTSKPVSSPWWNFVSASRGDAAATAATGGDDVIEIIYADDPKTVSTISTTRKSGGGRSDDKAVVAVLGMAHCNGIMKLLKEQKV